MSKTRPTGWIQPVMGPGLAHRAALETARDWPPIPAPPKPSRVPPSVRTGGVCQQPQPTDPLAGTLCSCAAHAAQVGLSTATAGLALQIASGGRAMGDARNPAC